MHVVAVSRWKVGSQMNQTNMAGVLIYVNEDIARTSPDNTLLLCYIKKTSTGLFEVTFSNASEFPKFIFNGKINFQFCQEQIRNFYGGD